MGLVLTRPSEVRVGDAVPELADLPCADDVVHVGGPVQPEAIMALAEFDDADEAVSPLVGRVGFMPAGADPGDLSISRLRVFAGYAGWGRGQRVGARGAVVDRRRRGAGRRVRRRPDELWRRVLHRKGGPSRSSRRCRSIPS